MFQTEVRVNELPFDEVRYDSLGRITEVITYRFKGTKVVATAYFTFNSHKPLDTDLESVKNLPEKVRKLFDAGVRVNVEYLVENGQLTRVKLE